MSFGGHVSAMITSLKNNSLPKRDKLFDRKTSYSKIQFKSTKKATKEQLEQARIQMKTENELRIVKHIIALIISLAIVSLIAYSLFILD
jgi:hypothetical protein